MCVFTCFSVSLVDAVSSLLGVSQRAECVFVCVCAHACVNARCEHPCGACVRAHGFPALPGDPGLPASASRLCAARALLFL